ncbi:RNA polymerase sigma factor [Streptomyces sp. JJ38]|nr:RNA polymerase sigma factor [Streptomyces sp. JJ38]
MLALCRRITHDDHDAHDALQNALLAAWQRMGSHQGRSSVGTWLCRVAINASLDELRRRRRRPDPTSEIALAAAPTHLDDTMTTRVALLWAMEQLPPSTRAVVLLRDHYGLSYREIAERHGTSTDAVRARLARGRRALAGLLESRRQQRSVRIVPETPPLCEHGS